MKRTGTAFFVMTMLAALMAGCSPQSAPTPTPATPPTAKTAPPSTAQAQQANQGSNGPRVTNEDLADRGKQPYSGNQAPNAHRQLVMDARNSQKGDTTRSAHGMAYELESLPAVKGASVLVVGRDAFVGVRSPAEGPALQEADRQTIVAKIEQMDQTITKVWITDEPNAVQYLSDYTGALEQGRPIAAYQDKFNDIVKKTWPAGTR